MNNYQDEQPEQDWQPRFVLPRPLAELANDCDLAIMQQMYDAPHVQFPDRSFGIQNHYRMFLMTIGGHLWTEIEIFAAYGKLMDTGMVALNTSQDGYQLTAEGRYYFRLHLEQRKRDLIEGAKKAIARQKQQEADERYRAWEDANWDDLIEQRMREIDTY
jgi:hypothetical protein